LYDPQTETSSKTLQSPSNEAVAMHRGANVADARSDLRIGDRAPMLT